jgi:hypothetical protein
MSTERSEGGNMKTTGWLIILGLLSSRAFAAGFVLEKTDGDVAIRHGVAESWSNAAPGDVLRPDDTIKTGKRGSALLVATLERNGKAGKKHIALPANVIIDLSDIRDLTQQELMLKLTMEKVRASSYQWKNNDLQMAPTTAIHGEDRSSAEPLHEGDLHTGTMLLNGVKVLFSNGFYATCALKGMQILRTYPALNDRYDNRILIAESLEKADLRGEALSEYTAISSMAGLTTEQATMIQERIQNLRTP